ncbi:hypothetical protein ACFUJR_01305 [Streptomyces sp. NPDC057271]|uniref:hypothetical protein n=1 Tax=unclassified Streptomyces TaxID=2593676 RepID=UPI00362741E2
MATSKVNGTASATSSSGAGLEEAATSEVLPQAAAEGERGESEKAEGARTKPAVVPTGSPATSTGEASASGTAAAPGSETRQRAESPAASEAQPGTGVRTETATAAQIAPTTGSGPDAARPLGRPTRPMTAAAVVGGLLLIGIPFLVSGLSGPDDAPPSASGRGPVGSLITPDGSGPGVVPGQQNAPDTGRVGSPAPGGPREAGAVRPGAVKGGAAGGLHEGDGAPHEGSGTQPEPTVAGSRGTGTGTAPTQRPSSGTGASGGTGGEGTQTVRQPAPVTYAHFIGPGCDTPGFATSDRYTDGTKGWRGSWESQKAYGCNGLFYSLPLSNSTSRPSGAYAHWRFPTGKVTQGRCAVEVFIPNVKDISYVGGNPAHYTVYRSFRPQSSTKVGTFEINQTAHLGQWVSAGTYRVDQGRLSVILDNRGTTSGNRHVAAAPVRINCTA